jgi:hypothetical protein
VLSLRADNPDVNRFIGSFLSFESVELVQLSKRLSDQIASTINQIVSANLFIENSDVERALSSQ